MKITITIEQGFDTWPLRRWLRDRVGRARCLFGHHQPRLGGMERWCFFCTKDLGPRAIDETVEWRDGQVVR